MFKRQPILPLASLAYTQFLSKYCKCYLSVKTLLYHGDDVLVLLTVLVCLDFESIIEGLGPGTEEVS